VKPAPFDYHAPTTLDDAVGLLREHGDDAKLLAGGQSLVPILAMRLARFDALVDLRRVDALRGIQRSNGDVSVGAMTTQATIERDPTIAAHVPLLAKATRLIGHFQIRNRGTVGGSIAHADPAAELPAVTLALDAALDVAGPDGMRTVRAADFFVSTFMTALEPADVLTAIRFPVWGAGSGFAVEEVARRYGDFALAGVACAVQVESGNVGRVAIAMFGMGSTPVRAATAEAAAVGTPVDALDVDELGRVAVQDLDPPSDIHASRAYRHRVGAVLVGRALRRAVEEANGG
jgi:aerobic carbon-monoxide dehydrogenase medium subunit